MPVTGTWRISFSLNSQVEEDYNDAFVYHNGVWIWESVYNRYNEWYVARSTGGREILRMAKEGDTLSLRTANVGDKFYKILACFEYVS